jgi:hypothetical protein
MPYGKEIPVFQRSVMPTSSGSSSLRRVLNTVDIRIQSFKMVVVSQQSTQHYNPQDFNLEMELSDLLSLQACNEYCIHILLVCFQPHDCISLKHVIIPVRHKLFPLFPLVTTDVKLKGKR